MKKICLGWAICTFLTTFRFAYAEDHRNLSDNVTSAKEKTVSSSHCATDPCDEGYVINFKNVGFAEYLHFLSKLTNTNFVYNEEDVQFTVSVMAEEPTDITQVRAALLQILRTRGLTLTEQDNNVVIAADPNMRSLAPVVSEELGNLCDTSEALITRVFRLRHANPAEVAAIISSMLSVEALVEYSLDSHHLIVTDLTANVEKVSDLLKSLDNPRAAFEIGRYVTKNGNIEDLITLAEQILFPIAENNPVVMVPQMASDSIFIVSTPYLVQKALELLKTLDVGGEGQLPADHLANSQFLIYKLQYHIGNQIQETLQELGSDLAGTGNINPALVSAINTAQWIPTTNSLLFVGDPKTLQRIKELVEVLDAPLRQVCIEVLAVRTSLNNTLELGVEYGYRGKAGNRVVASGSLLTTPNPSLAGSGIKPNVISQGIDVATGPGIPVPLTPNQLGLANGVIGNVLRSGGNLYFDIAALVTALQTDQSTAVILNPKVVTQDTVPADIYVGSTRPFQTNSILQASGSSTGNFVTASIEYRQLGTTLQVTPFLGKGDMITLEINQQTSNYVNNAVSQGGGSDNFAIVPVTTDSSITTRVQVPDKHFLMISGMLEDIQTKTKTAVPCLGGLPWIGDLFGTRSSSVEKDNLIIFIRPHIIDTAQEMQEFTKEEDKFYRQKTKGESFLKNSVKLYKMQ